MRKSFVVRFWSKVQESKDGCWMWTDHTSNVGYGMISTRRSVKYPAHRLAYMMVVGDPGDRMVLHHCDVRSCVRPSHLFLGTAADNTHDMMAKRRSRFRGMEPLRDSVVREIRASSLRTVELVEIHHRNQATIDRIRGRRSYKEVM